MTTRRRWGNEWASGAVLLAAALAAPARAAPQAQRAWWDRAVEARAGAYWIKTDLPASEADRLARHLNVMHAEYSRRLASLPPRAPEALNVLIFAAQADYLFTLRTRFGIDGTGTGGMFFVQGGTQALALWTEDLPHRRIEHVLQHEGFHQFAYSRFGSDLPLWVNEGLAEFFGASLVVGRSLVIGQAGPRIVSAMKDAIERSEFIPFREMLTMTPQRWGAAIRDGRAGLLYHQAWSMVHFLVYADPDGDGAADYVRPFERYLHKLNAAAPPERAFIDVFGEDIAAFEQRWTDYALRARPGAFAAALERIEFLVEGALELSRRAASSPAPAPASMDELRNSLRAIDFSIALTLHGASATLRAADDANFIIPMDDLCREQPVFAISRLNTNRLTRREQIEEARLPMPALIATENLEPRNITVRWIRDEKRGAFRYELEVK